MTTQTQTQLSLYSLLSMLSEQTRYDAELIVKSQEEGIEALYLDLDYLDDLLAQVDEIADAFIKARRVKQH